MSVARYVTFSIWVSLTLKIATPFAFVVTDTGSNDFEVVKVATLPTRITLLREIGKPSAVRKVTLIQDAAVRLALTCASTAIIEDLVGEA